MALADDARAVTPQQKHGGGGHGPLPGRRVIAAWFGAFAVYAGLMITTRHADGTWGLWGCCGYAAAALLLLFRTGWVLPLAAAVGGALLGPLLWLITSFPATGEVVVIGQSARYLLAHGTPYLPSSLITSWLSYNPYLPLMELFGLPRAAGLTGLLGDPRIWTTLSTVLLLAVAFAVSAPHRVGPSLAGTLALLHRAGLPGVRGVVPPGDSLRGVRGVVPPGDSCAHCRARVAWRTALAVASPVIALPLAVGVTDPPILALTCLALALASRGALLRAAVTVAVGCAMKTTAWAVVPVLAVLAWTRTAPRAAVRCTAAVIGLTAALALAAAPEALATPGALKQNLIDYPLGLSRYKTVAASPLPGHLIAGLGRSGRLTVDVLLVLAVAAFAVWLLARPPRDARDAAWRLAVGYAVLFTLDPSTRFGYYAYPLALLGWLALTKTDHPDSERGVLDPVPRTAAP